MIPVEMITMGTSVLTGIVGKVIGVWMDNKRTEKEIFLAHVQKDMDVRKQISEDKNERMAWTRQIIALVSLFSIILLPKIIHFWPWISFHPVVYFQEVSKTKEVGFWFWQSATTTTNWVPVHGLPISQLDIHIMMAVIGLYLGASIAGRK